MPPRKPDPFPGYRDELNRTMAAINAVRGTAPVPNIATRLGMKPIIFANGRDDDGPGLVAAVCNEPVMYGDRVYEPGEPITIKHRQLRTSRRIYVRGPGCDGTGLSDEWVCITPPADGRQVLISHSTIRFSREAAP